MCPHPWRIILAEDSYKQRKPANKDGNSDGRSEGASHSGRSGSRSSNDGYKPREGGYKPREGGQGGYRPREGGQGGYRPREGGAAPARTYSDEAPRAPTDEERGLGKDTGDDKIGVKIGSRRSEDYTRSYRGSSARATSNQRAKGPNSNRKGKPATREAVRKQPMLSMHKIQPFKYDMNEILNETSMDPAKASAFLATVVAKASRISLKDAKEYIAEVVEAGDLTKDEQTRFNNLLQKYSKYR